MDIPFSPCPAVNNISNLFPVFIWLIFTVRINILIYSVQICFILLWIMGSDTVIKNACPFSFWKTHEHFSCVLKNINFIVILSLLLENPVLFNDKNVSIFHKILYGWVIILSYILLSNCQFPFKLYICTKRLCMDRKIFKHMCINITHYCSSIHCL